MLIIIGLSWCHKFQLHFMSLMPQIKGTFIKIERFKMKPCPSQKKMTRVRGSNITQYFFHTLIWSLVDSDESLGVTRVSPPIFGLKHCCRFRKGMQLNIGSLRLSLVSLLPFPSTLSFLPFLFLQFLFLLQFIFLLLYFLLQPMLILTGLSLCHKFQLHFMSLMPQRERSSRLSVLKLSHAHLKRRWQEVVGAISHNTSFTHCLVLNLMLAWFGWNLGDN